MIKVDVIVDEIRWKYKIKKIDNFFNQIVKLFPKKYYLRKKNIFLTFLLSNNQSIKKLNFKFRKKNKPTDVLSFQSDNKFYIGDIAIGYEIVNKRSKLTNFFIEFDKMWIHGYFHLNGYDHKKIKDYKRMIRKENLVLNYFHK